MLVLLLCLPWLLLGLYTALAVHLPPPLPRRRPEGEARPVGIVVPARNEVGNIARCVASLAAQDYTDFGIVVVDDRSEDGTGEVARGMAPGGARSLRVVEGRPLPDGWFGKPWACAQGAEAADGDLLLFTDADTVHAPDLLSRAVAALEEDHADALTVLGEQLLGSFWERVVQPHVFLTMAGRWRDLRRPLPPERWRDAIANGQYILIRRDVYRALGGHEAVKGDVVEDLRLAQELVKRGHRLSVREARDGLATRMYTSLRELVAGWTKNVATGARQSAPPALAGIVLPAAIVFEVGLWIVPPVALALSAIGVGGPILGAWSLSATSLGVVYWGFASRYLGASPLYGLTYPLGAALLTWIYARSWLRGARIEWKGRTYGDAGLSEGGSATPPSSGNGT